MKKLILSLWGLIALGGALRVGAQTIMVTPQTLNGWVVTGADKSALSQATELTLPPGAQLSRLFEANIVVVQFNAQPVFGATGENFTSLAVGPAALVFARDGTDGQLVLVMGDTTVVPLPFTVKLNVDGSSVEPVDVQLAYDRSTGIVIVAGFGQTLQYSGEPSTEPVEVAITSGADDALTLQNLDVLVVAPNTAIDNAKNGAQTQTDANSGTAAGRASGKQPSVEQLVAVALGLNTTGNSTDQKPPAQGVRSTLEVYTPPAVRHRAAAVLKAVKAIQNK